MRRGPVFDSGAMLIYTSMRLPDAEINFRRGDAFDGHCRLVILSAQLRTTRGHA